MFPFSQADDPDQPVTFLVGPDGHGHWLVQQQGGSLEGSFRSQDAALRFARWEGHAFASARVVLAGDLLTPRIAA